IAFGLATGHSKKVMSTPKASVNVLTSGNAVMGQE
ncbi:MAG: hypothetical protein RL149_67, partial [Actinomycetota bacterium]